MNIEDVYRGWAAEDLGISSKLIKKVSFSHSVGGGSIFLESDDFSTFAGCEIWKAEILMKNGSYRSINLYDYNPVSAIAYWAEKRGYKIEFDSSLTSEELLEAHIRRN